MPTRRSPCPCRIGTAPFTDLFHDEIVSKHASEDYHCSSSDSKDEMVMDVVIYLHPFFEVGQKENDDTTSSKCDAKVDGGSYAHRRITDLRRNDFLGTGGWDPDGLSKRNR